MPYGQVSLVIEKPAICAESSMPHAIIFSPSTENPGFHAKISMHANTSLPGTVKTQGFMLKSQCCMPIHVPLCQVL